MYLNVTLRLIFQNRVTYNTCIHHSKWLSSLHARHIQLDPVSPACVKHAGWLYSTRCHNVHCLQDTIRRLAYTSEVGQWLS